MHKVEILIFKSIEFTRLREMQTPKYRSELEAKFKILRLGKKEREATDGRQLGD